MIDVHATLAVLMAVASPSVTNYTGGAMIDVPAEAMSDDVVVYGTPAASHVDVITAVIEAPPIDSSELTADRDGKSLRRQREEQGSDAVSRNLDAAMRNARELIRR